MQIYIRFAELFEKGLNCNVKMHPIEAYSIWDASNARPWRWSARNRQFFCDPWQQALTEHGQRSL